MGIETQPLLDGWQPKTVGDGFRITEGVTYASADYVSEDSGNIFLTIKCFTKGGGFNPEGIKYFRGVFLPEQQVKSGELIIAKTDLTRAGDIIGSPMLVPAFGTARAVLPSMDLCVLRPYNEEIDLRFLFYRLMLFDARCFMRAHSAGSTVLHLESSALPRFSIRVPEPNKQRQISAILAKVDEAIAKTEKVIAKLRQVRAGLLHDLLTRGLDKNGQLRNATAHPEQFQDSPLGRIPREWTVDALESCCSHVIDCPHSTPNYLPVGVLVARTMHIRDGRYDVEASSRVTEEAFAERTARLVPQAGDVIFTREAPVGEAFVIPPGMRICLGQRVMLLRPGDKLTAGYLIAQIYSGAVRQRIDSLTGGTTNPHLNVAEVRKFAIPLPEVDEQKRIATCLSAHDGLMESETAQLDKLHQLKSGLMMDLLTGRVRVCTEEE